MKAAALCLMRVVPCCSFNIGSLSTASDPGHCSLLVSVSHVPAALVGD